MTCASRGIELARGLEVRASLVDGVDLDQHVTGHLVRSREHRSTHQCGPEVARATDRIGDVELVLRRREVGLGVTGGETACDRLDRTRMHAAIVRHHPRGGGGERASAGDRGAVR